jgi:hypothetical protein
MPSVSEPTRRAAVRRLTEERAEILALIERLPPRALSRPGLGGGEWSPKDLIGHLESWEEHALAALEAWSRDEPAPIDRALRGEGLTRVNEGEVRRKSRRSAPVALASAAATHERLVAAILAMSDRAWKAPATSRGRVPLGHRLGQILVGTRDPFTHDSAHVRDLRAFVDDHEIQSE